MREQRGKVHAGVGDGAAADGQVWPPCFTAGREKGNSFFPKGAGENDFCLEAKKWNDPFPRGGNRAKIGGKTETRETFLWISKKDWDG